MIRYAALGALAVLLESGPLLAQAPSPNLQFARLPLQFEPSPGGFLAHGGGGMLEVAADSVNGRVALRLEGARSKARVEGVRLLAGESHYLVGNDPKKWRTHVPNYGRVRVRDAWPGIDVIYYGNGGELEFDFVVAAGADPSRIQFVAERGRLRDPAIYQETAGGRHAVAGRYARHGTRLAFELAAYDRKRPLIIDPVIEYSTALGGGAYDSGSAIAVDDRGAAYVFGVTDSGNFPVKSALQPAAAPGFRLFVAKLAPGGGALEYSTYLGGTAVAPYLRDFAGGIAVDSSGSAYLTGSTASPDFPIAGPAPLQKSFADRDFQEGFAARLSADGSSLVYSTFLGGASGNRRVAVDRAGAAYFAGVVSDPKFPVVNPLAGASGPGLYLAKLGSDGTPVYATFLGISGFPGPTGIAADKDGNVYLTGSANPQGFPLVNALEGPVPGNSFVTKVKSDGTALIYSTFFGGSGQNQINAIAADASGNAYIAGNTNSTDFPTAHALQAHIGAAAMYKSTDGGVSSARSDLGLPGSVTNVAVDPMDCSNLYALGAGQSGPPALFRSTNAGASWGLVLANVSAFAFDPTASGTLYAGTIAGPNAPPSILKSSDGGNNWTRLSPLAGEIHALVVDPGSPATLYAGTGGAGNLDGAYKSTDGGGTWTPAFIGRSHGVRFLALDPRTPAVYAYSPGAGFDRSTDAGQSWSPLPNLPENTYPSGIFFDPGDAATFYLPAGDVVLKSTDGGQSFSSYAVGAFSSYPGSMAFDPANRNTLYNATSRGVYKSMDGGQTWNPTAITGSVSSVAIDAYSTLYASASVAPNAFVSKLNPQGSALIYSTYLGGTGPDSANAIAVDAAGNAYVAGSTFSVNFPSINSLPDFLASGGNQFLAKLTPDGSALAYATLFSGQVNGLAVDTVGAVYLTGNTSRTDFPSRNAIQNFTTGTFFRSSDGGATWTGNPSGDSFPSSIVNLAIDPKNPNRIFAQTSSRIYRSADGGATFAALRVPFSNILSIALDPGTPALYAGTGSGPTFGIYKSTDDGQTWTRLGDLSLVNAIAVAPNSPSTIFAATDAGLMKSTDGGANWVQSGSFYTVYTVIFDPQDSQTLYASTAYEGIFKTIDEGAHWTAVNNGFPNAGGPAAKVLAVNPLDHSVIYAAGRDGIFRSVNGGANWAAIDAGLKVRQGYWVSTFGIDPAAISTLYAGLDSGGLYKSTDGGASWSLTGLAFPTISALAFDPRGPGRIVIGANYNPADAFITKILP